MEAAEKIVLPGEVHPVRNPSRCDSKPSGALDPAESFQNVTLLQISGATFLTG